eukprot:1878062-Amphidinium_carterae.1
MAVSQRRHNTSSIEEATTMRRHAWSYWRSFAGDKGESVRQDTPTLDPRLERSLETHPLTEGTVFAVSIDNSL